MRLRGEGVEEEGREVRRRDERYMGGREGYELERR
jgi:hypothetical protein